ncbi:MAG TPA: hypothetical protein VIN37_06585 [Candidatus Limnocylindria bacterium]|jgi:hypothetical protein
MPNDKTARPTDDLADAERKSKTVDERVPEHQSTDAVPEIELPGAITRGGPILGADTPGPGEVVLEQEAKAQRGPTMRG